MNIQQEQEQVQEHTQIKCCPILATVAYSCSISTTYNHIVAYSIHCPPITHVQYSIPHYLFEDWLASILVLRQAQPRVL